MMVLTEYFVKMAEILPEASRIKTRQINGGFSNAVYLISVDQLPYCVLRVPMLDEAAFGINRAHEIRVIEVAAKASISPNMLWKDEEGAFAAEFVPQPSLDWGVCHRDVDIPRLAAMMAQVHRLPKGNHSYCVFATIDHYLSEIGGLVAKRGIVVSEYAYLQRRAQTFTPPPLLLPLVLCHNDINPKNTLMDRQDLWLIDWEYSGVGDPLFDLAVVAKSHNLTREQTALLVSAYCPDLPDDESFHVIEIYKRAYGLREMVWLLLKHLMTPHNTKSLQEYFQFKETPSLNPFYS